MSREHRVALFIGPPGAGKGSLSEYCKRELGWKQLSTGNLLRRHISEQTELGKHIDLIIKSGKLVSDELINTMVEQWLREVYSQGCTGVILDGYPRTIAQAKALNTLFERDLKALQLNVVRFLVDDQVAIDRISARFICINKDCQAVYSGLKHSSMRPKEDMACDKCQSPIGKRKDDHESVVKDRLSMYRKHESDLLHFYQKIGLKVIECDAGQSMGNLFNEFKTLMNIH